MTDLSSAALALRPGKHNMASEAFEQLRANRRNNMAPAEGATLTFNDVLDTLNPLQHIPVISDIYRNLTGDRISEQARVMGGTLYGGPFGMISSVASAAIAAANDGKDLGEQAIAAIFGDDDKSEDKPATSVASAEPEAPASTDGETLLRDSLKANEKTASIAMPAPAKPTADKIPELSPEAFNALMGAFEEKPKTPVKSPASAHQAGTPLALNAASVANSAAATQTPADLMAKMQEAMDKYQALKAGALPTPGASF